MYQNAIKSLCNGEQSWSMGHCSKTKVLSYHVEVNLLCSEKFLEII